MMTLPRRKRRLKSSRSSAKKKVVAAKRQWSSGWSLAQYTPVARTQSPPRAVGAAGRRRQQRCGRGGPRPPPPNLTARAAAAAGRRAPATGGVPGCRPPDTRHGDRPDQSGAPTKALKPTVHLPWPKSASPCRRPAYRRPHETAAWALITGGQICAPPTGLASATKKSPHGMPSAWPSRRWVEDAAADVPAWGLHQMQARRGGRGRGRAREENEKTPSLPS